MRFPYSHDILMCVQIIWKLQSHKPTSGTAAILSLPISSSSGIEKYYSQGLFFAMPLSLSFLQQRSYYSRYSEKYCMCALCVHWVCNNNIQGALSPESLLRPSISLLLNLRQKKKEYHIDFGMYYIVYFMDNGHEYCLLCCLLIVHILAS